MEITVTDKEVKIKWGGDTYVSHEDIATEMFKNADERERKRLAVIHVYTRLFTPVEEEKPKRKGTYRHLTTENLCDIARGLDDAFEGIDNPHWIVE